MKKITQILIILIIMVTLTSCSKTKTPKEEVNVLNWSSYIPNEIIKGFEKEYNIKVNYGTYSSNEELLAKLSSSKEGTYDLIFPSDYMLELMVKRNMIKKIDKTKIENIENINPIFLKQEYDKNNEYSLPFLIATVVIAINKENIVEEITSYNDLLNKKYKNNIVLLDDQRIIIGMALQALGYDMNEIDVKKLEEAKNWLLELKDNVKAFDSDSPKTFLITKETDIGVMWNAEATLAKQENENIEIVYPKEGHVISVDNYAITKSAKNVDNVYLLINYLLRNDVSQKIIAEYPYVSSNVKASNLFKHEIDNILEKSNYVKNIGSNITKYDKIWAEIK